MVTPLFDSHAHLGFDGYEADLEEVLDRAWAGGVRGVVIIGSGGGLESMNEARRVAGLRDWLWATVGLHPHDAKMGDEATLAALAEAAAAPDVVGVGEAGLDYHYDFSPREQQREVFRAQVRLAREVGKPLIVHTREADSDTLDILKSEGLGPAGGVIHCFSGGPEFARACLDLGMFISFSGIVTFKTAEEVRQAAAIVPDEALMIETDSPYLAPPPHRGRRNEPAWVVEIARTLAAVRGVSAEDIARITTRNARRFYGLPLDETAPIVYRIGDRLYVNATNRCTLDCRFCPKRRDWVVKGYMLRHETEPSDEAVRAALLSAELGDVEEVVFCGLGEPTMRLALVIELGRALRSRGVRTRLDTDGLASLREGRDVTPELSQAFDAVSVSLNAPDGDTYAAICPSPLGAAAHEAVVEFIRAMKARPVDVTATVVAVPEVDVEEARGMVERELGVSFRVRPYRSRRLP